MKLYIQIRGKAQGPCPVEEVRSLLANGWLSPSDLGQYEGESQWQPLSSIPELKLEPESEAQPPSEPVPEPVLEEVPPKASRPRRPAVRIPWKSVLKGIVLLALIGGLGYGAVVVLQRFKSNPPQILTRIRDSMKRQEKPVAADQTKTNVSVEAISSSIQAPAVATSPTPAATPVPADVAPITNPAQAVALIDAGVIHESRPVLDTSASSSSPGTLSAKVDSRRRTIAAADLDPKMTPFGQYDVAMIQSIQKRWLEILNEQNVAQGRSGRVIIEFKLSLQGRASDLRIAETTAEEILAYLCEKAIRESEPFSPWPPDLRKLVKDDYRLMRFTFHY
ncbi:MAG TPA: GYF domain-containing protein [Candidatus Paceibacterota bacterium]|nr:GYF domain-containing protein [Verrucomicrobiota bacterium]HRY47930.1 GYF domain-containing protein [Candidatus Paceibacterota bacterium]HSA02871.1 GYF domain-containing protein [Candidatus Paceibacterota bacterium]